MRKLIFLLLILCAGNVAYSSEDGGGGVDGSLKPTPDEIISITFGAGGGGIDGTD